MWVSLPFEVMLLAALMVRVIRASDIAVALNRPDRIVGGDPVPKGDALWQVSIQSRYGHHFCGGTLVRYDWVVTAAHCTMKKSPADMRVAVGTNSLTEVENYYDVDYLVRNEGFDLETMVNDIALLKLKMKGRTQNSGTPINMGRGENLEAGNNCRITGFGRLTSGGEIPNNMMSAEVPIRSFEDCRKAFPADSYTLTEGNLCAGGGQTDACQGDSGGPLVCCSSPLLRTSTCKLEGVTSWGIGCATPNLPGVYTKVAYFRAWVEEKISADERGTANRG